MIWKNGGGEKFGTTPGLPEVEAGPHRAPPASPDAVPGRSQKAPLTDLAERAPCPPKSSTGPAGPKRPALSGIVISTANLQSKWKRRPGLAHRARAHAEFAARHAAGEAQGAGWSWRFRMVRACLASEAHAHDPLTQTRNHAGRSVGSRNIPIMKTSLLKPALAAIALTAFNQSVISATGDLDPAFGTAGIVIATSPYAISYTSMALQNNGKILAAGSSVEPFTRSNFAVVRYNSDGSLDTTFNSTGQATTSLTNNDDYGESVAVQSDGKIVVAGRAFNGSKYDIGVVRYNTDGTLDTTFNSTGKKPRASPTEIVTASVWPYRATTR